MAFLPDDSLNARLRELCLRSLKLQIPVYTRFLSPPEAAAAGQAAREHKRVCTFSGGYPSAERLMACFHPEGEGLSFPIRCLHITWDTRYHQAEHRSILGSILGLGIERNLIGDISLAQGGAYLLAAEEMADFIAANLVKAGRVPVKTCVLDSIPDMEPAQGKVFRDTVASLRLDAVLAAGLNLSRAKAAECIQAGQVFKNHLPEMRPDTTLREGDLLSIRGHGRLLIQSVGPANRKGRIPIQFESHGIHTS